MNFVRKTYIAFINETQIIVYSNYLWNNKFLMESIALTV